MNNKRNPVYLLLFVLLALFAAACDGTKTEGKVMPLTEVLKSDLSHVDSIEVRFGDGNKMSINDSKTIQDIVSQIEGIRVRETNSKSVGYLYFLEWKAGDKEYRLDSNLTVDGKTYEAIDDHAKKWNDFLVKMGRDKIPGLLPGVEIDEGDLAEPLPADKDDVFWSHKEVRNLSRLEQFMENVNQKTNDEIRVLSSDKEGGAIETRLTFDGETIQVTVNDVQKNYDQIFLEKRYVEHYKGTFLNYYVGQKDSGERRLILQIHPDLQQNQESR
ncbi:DUF4362 domain-containing protein [Brevibacillus massiliensis]|uniref:DUF4362 domain-containing protein n=1 Tax=Brevibacillus massiliensis TaxID=1118054 RepID=UPI0002F1D83C|nr:DUF4362 domain-containing protein [Brevibacillus massiliensis]